MGGDRAQVEKGQDLLDDLGLLDEGHESLG
jgi:hypothetical protein